MISISLDTKKGNVSYCSCRFPTGTRKASSTLHGTWMPSQTTAFSLSEVCVPPPPGFNLIYTLSRKIHQYSFYVQSMSIFNTPANSGWQKSLWKAETKVLPAATEAKSCLCASWTKDKISSSAVLPASAFNHFTFYVVSCSNASYALSKENRKSALCNISYYIARLCLILSDFIPNQDCVI